MIITIKTLWNYRGFIISSVNREFQARHRNSLLGSAWTLLNPLATITIYTVIFAKIMHTKLPSGNGTFSYSIYLCAGIFTWGLFTEVINRSQNTFLENSNLLKKLNFPHICLPIIVLANALINFSIIFSLFTVFLILNGDFPGFPYFALFPVLLILSILAIGLGTILGILNVFFRDVGQFFGIFMNFWFWATPIVYPLDILPASVAHLVQINPMVSLISACQTILVQGHWPEWSSLLPSSLLAVALCALAFRLFQKRAGEMVDEL